MADEPSIDEILASLDKLLKDTDNGNDDVAQHDAQPAVSIDVLFDQVVEHQAGDSHEADPDREGTEFASGDAAEPEVAEDAPAGEAAEPVAVVEESADADEDESGSEAAEPQAEQMESRAGSQTSWLPRFIVDAESDAESGDTEADGFEAVSQASSAEEQDATLSEDMDPDAERKTEDEPVADGDEPDAASPEEASDAVETGVDIETDMDEAGDSVSDESEPAEDEQPPADESDDTDADGVDETVVEAPTEQRAEPEPQVPVKLVLTEAMLVEDNQNELPFAEGGSFEAVEEAAEPEAETGDAAISDMPEAWVGLIAGQVAERIEAILPQLVRDVVREIGLPENNNSGNSEKDSDHEPE